MTRVETLAEIKNCEFLTKRAVDYAKVYSLLKDYYEIGRREVLDNHYYGYDSPEATMTRKNYKKIHAEVHEFLRNAGETGALYTL